jgi:hypothetical protein
MPALLLAALMAAPLIGCAFVPAGHAQSSYCLSDSVNGKLLASMRSALRTPSVPAAIQVKSDSAYVSHSDSLCTVAVHAYNASAGGPEGALYVVVIPGVSYAVMSASPDGKLVTITWFTPAWTDPVAMEP